MKRKNLTILFCIVAVAAVMFTACNVTCETDHEGEIHMGEITTVQLTESISDESVSAEVVLHGAIPETYDDAILEIGGVQVAWFNGQGKAEFTPDTFGNVPCEVVFMAGGAEIARIADTLIMEIETWFVGVHPGLGHALEEIEQDGTVNVFTQPRARGNSDICFRLVVRVPHGQTETIAEECSAVSDPRPRYNTVLDVHYRGVDYRDRNDLYTPPDEAMFHIDPEVDKWIESPVELGHGVHVLYVAPSLMHDLSFLTVTGAGGYGFVATGYFKTLDWEALGLP